MIRVTENLASVRESLEKSAVAAGREPHSVKLLAVSKKQPLSKILAAANAGQLDFGENFVNEAIEKIAQSEGSGLIWHFLGHLQNNKTRAVAENFDWVHTIDTQKTARRLSEQRPSVLGPINICLQVNIDDEPGKSGVACSEVTALAAACRELPNLRLRGLMCLPLARAAFSEQRRPFAQLRKLAQQLLLGGIHTDTLSMGMSEDFRAAIFEGATIVRIGTALFGNRD